MPLTLTTPIAVASVDSVLIDRVVWDVEADTIMISYVRKSGGTIVDHAQVTLAAAVVISATGAGMKAKVYNALATALGTSGTVS